MLDLDELSEHLQVQTNILNEKRAERERYERGVKAMAEASSKESQWIAQTVIGGVGINAQPTVGSLTLLVYAITVG